MFYRTVVGPRTVTPLKAVKSGFSMAAHNQKWMMKTRISARRGIAAKRLDIMSSQVQSSVEG